MATGGESHIAVSLPKDTQPDNGAMYTVHFGLAEAPFSITPDPRYLYMSERHREALAHLLYGVTEGGSVVQLTGEVGTGKTTLCRCLLEQLPPQVDVALVLNPKLTGSELLATVCDELGIGYPPGTMSMKLLVDALYRHLLDAHARGRRTVLIIDEAQNLPVDVLEQIRLLTNLETAKDKLLQIILIGQPELIRLLDRQKLRQLAQRVTARYHLLPFSMQETRAYVRHRLAVAGQQRIIFSDWAMRQVHRASGGVPRLINVICDRALLGAYAQDRNHVGAATARRAAMEVLGRVAWPGYARARVLVPALALAAAIAGTSLFLTQAQLAHPRGGARSLTSDHTEPLAASAATSPMLPVVEARDAGAQETPESAGARSAPHGTSVTAPAATTRAVLADVLSNPSLRSDKGSAFGRLFALWRVPYGAEDRLGCERGRSYGLACLFRVATWKKLRRLNLPAIIELVAPAGRKHYATVTALGPKTATVDFGGQQFTFTLSEIDAFWEGSSIVLWKPPALSAIPVHPGARGKAVEWLRQRLGELDGKPLAPENRDVYDDELQGRVLAFQRSRSLVPDGVVAEETLTQLSLALGDPGIPSLSSATP